MSTNSFSRALAGYDTSAESLCLFAEGMAAAFSDVGVGLWQVRLSQIFEPRVLTEAKTLAGQVVSPSGLESVDGLPPTAVIHARIPELTDLPPVRRSLAVAGLLVAASRFQSASAVLADSPVSSFAKEAFERAWIEFLISNRLHDGYFAESLVKEMLSLYEAGGVPAKRALDMCAQGVVWFLKGRQISSSTVSRLIRLGDEIVTREASGDPAGTSSWYRAVAMLPAENRNAGGVARLMSKARKAASEAVELQASPFNRNLMKTYYESALKEAVYIQRDYGRFCEVRERLLAQDSQWSISWAEIAQGEEVFGELDRALEAIDSAVALGAPYVWRHVYDRTRLGLRVGDVDAAKESFDELPALSAPTELIERAALSLHGLFPGIPTVKAWGQREEWVESRGP